MLLEKKLTGKYLLFPGKKKKKTKAKYLPFRREKYIFHSHKFLSGFNVWEKNKDSVEKKERNKMDYMIGTHTGIVGGGGG